MKMDEYNRDRKDRSLKEAREALEMYRQGLIAEEIARKMNKSIITIFRYYKLMGGITQKDTALHMQARYLKD